MVNKPVSGKFYYRSKARALAFAAVVMGSLPFVFSSVIDAVGRGIAFCLAGILVCAALYNKVRGERIASGTRVYEGISAAPAAIQIAYLKKMFFLACGAVPGLVIVMVWELRDVENGTRQSVDTVLPGLWFVYERYGYGAAVGAACTVGIVLLGILYAAFRYRTRHISPLHS